MKKYFLFSFFVVSLHSKLLIKTFKDMKSDRLNNEVTLSYEEFAQLRAALRENLSKNALDEVEIFNKINNFNL